MATEDQILEISNNFLSSTKGKKIIDQNTIDEAKKSSKELIPTLETFTINGKVYGESFEIFEKWNEIDNDTSLSDSQKKEKKLQATTSDTDGSFGGVKIGAVYIESPSNTSFTLQEQTSGLMNNFSSEVGSNAETMQSVDVSFTVPDVREINPLNTLDGAIYLPYPLIETENPESDPIDGSFSIDIKLPILPFNQKSLINVFLVYTKKGHLPKYQPILNGDRTIKSDLSSVKINLIEAEIERAKLQFNNKINGFINQASFLGLTPIEISLIQRRKNIIKITEIIKGTLIPLAVGLLIEFGITSLIQKNQKICPLDDQLVGITNKRNRVVKQLNNIYNNIGFNLGLAAAAFALGEIFRQGKVSIQNLTIPQAIGVPPPSGGLVFSQPISTTLKMQSVVDLMDELEQQNKELNRELLVTLFFAVAALFLIYTLLRGIDELIEDCSVGSVNLEDYSQGIRELTEQQEEEGTPIISSLNGFIFSIESEKNTIGSLQRRFAVAKNAQGVTLLKGEPSFSSVDQVLIDELIFYIETNNLKAN